MTNSIIVHGAWADGSGWQELHNTMRDQDYSVSIAQDLLTSLDDDVETVKCILARQNGATLLVGHDYGGAVITETQVRKAAWRSKPIWCVLSTQDRIITPATQRQMAGQANAATTKSARATQCTSSQPKAVVDAIVSAEHMFWPRGNVVHRGSSQRRKRSSRM